MTELDRLDRAALRAEAKQARALDTWKRWRKEAATLARFGRPWPAVLDARRQRQAAATRWARAREAARKARFKASLARDGLG